MVIPFLTVFLTLEQGYSAAEASVVMVAFGLGGVVGNYAGGLLNDRYGSWHIQLISLLLSGVVFVVLSVVDGFYLFCGTVFVLSLVADAFRPANRAAVALYTKPSQLTKAYGLQRMAVNLGFSLGPLLGGLILSSFSYSALFWADGLTCFASGLVFLLLLPADETARPPVAAGNKKPHRLRAEVELEGKVATSSVKAGTPGHQQDWLLIVCGANVLIACAFFLVFNTVPVYLKQRAYTELEISTIFTVSGLIIVLCEMPLLQLTKAWLSPLRAIVWGSGLVVGSYFFLPTAISLGLVALGLFTILLTFGEILYMPFMSTYVAQRAPLARRGEYLGLLSASYSLAFVCSPLLGLNVAEWLGFAPSTYLIASLGLVGTGLVYWLHGRQVRTFGRMRDVIQGYAS